jgi:formylglycine-generating enzyme
MKQMRIRLQEGIELELCWCPPGSFLMGENDPPNEKVSVRLTQGFWMGKYPVTQGQWRSVMGGNPSHFKGDTLPVEQVSWNDTQEFLACVNEGGFMPSGLKLVLPTEAQWEYACRAGTETEYWWGDSCNGTECNCDGTEPHNTEQEGPWLRETSPVGQYRANPWGLYDMHGNVEQWCADWWAELEGGVDPCGPGAGKIRVFRGGGWSDDAWRCRAAARPGGTPGASHDGLGFRVAAAPGAEP